MRIDLLERHPVGGGLYLHSQTVRRIDAEMALVREPLTQRLRDTVLLRLG